MTPRADPLVERITSGKWAEDCWLLKPSVMKQFRSAFSPSQIRRSISELTRLFPAEVCAGPLDRRTVPSVTVGLFFEGSYWNAWEPLFLGHDLVACPGWETDSNLVSDLRLGHKYQQRRVEVGVWAGLRRRGLEVGRLEAAAHKRTPDFLVNLGGRDVVLEVKTLGASSEDQAANEVDQAFTQCLYYCQGRTSGLTLGMGKRVLVWLEKNLVEGLGSNRTQAEVKHQLLVLAPLIAERVLLAMEGDTYPFAFHLPGLGDVRIETTGDAKTFQPMIVNLPDTPFPKEVQRALRSLRSASGQQRDGHPMVVALHSSRYTLPAGPARETLATEILLEPERFQGIDAVLLHNHYREHFNRGGGMVHEVVSWRPPWSRLDSVPKALEEGIQAWQEMV